MSCPQCQRLEPYKLKCKDHDPERQAGYVRPPSRTSVGKTWIGQALAQYMGDWDGSGPSAIIGRPRH